MIGRRVDDVDVVGFEPGNYGQFGGTWYGMTPNGLLANLTNHTVTVHDDDTITVAPSIYVNRGQPVEWHGYLERGVWRSC